MNIKEIEQHINKIYVSQDVYDKLCEAGNIDKGVFSFGACVSGVDVIVKDYLPPNTCMHLTESLIKSYLEAIEYDIVLKSERMEQLLEGLLS